MIVPGILFYLIFMYGPLYGALIAFKDYSPGLGFLESPWVGLKHFKDFFASSECFRLIYNTLKINLAALCFGFPAPIVLAILINEMGNGKFKRFTQTVSYMPHFISLVVICGLVKNFVSADGIISSIVAVFSGEKANLLTIKEWFVPIYVGSNIWQDVGWGSIIYLAALSAIDECLYESAQLDGAGHMRILFSIILPLAKATVAVVLLYYAVEHWNSWFNAVLFLNDREKYPLQLILREILIQNDTSSMAQGFSMSDQFSIAESIKYAVTIVATVPILCVYPFLQKYFASGVMQGAVKG